MDRPHVTQTRIKLTKGGRTIAGELVVQHLQAWMVAVDGEVGVYQKDEWTEIPLDFGDIFGMFGMSR